MIILSKDCIKKIQKQHKKNQIIILCITSHEYVSFTFLQAVIRAGFGINGLHLWSQDAHIFYKDDDHMLLQSTVILNLQQLYIFI